MPVSITKRITKGAPLTPAEHDQNLQNLKDACDDNSLAVTGRVTTAAFNAAFEGDSDDGKKLVDWDNIVNPPNNTLPTGAVLDFAGNAAPTGFLLCDGAAVSRVTYAPLFGVIGGIYGVGDGTNTFNLPDFRGRAAVGRGLGDDTHATTWTLGQKKGSESVVLTEAQLAKHRHLLAKNGAVTGVKLTTADQVLACKQTNADSDAHDYTLGSATETDPEPLVGKSSEVGDDQAHSNVQPSLTVSKIIKT